MTEALELAFTVLGCLSMLAAFAFDLAVAPPGQSPRARIRAVRVPLLLATACFAARGFLADHSIVVVALWAAAAATTLLRFVARMATALRARPQGHPGS